MSQIRSLNARHVRNILAPSTSTDLKYIERSLVTRERREDQQNEDGIGGKVMTEEL